MVDLHGILFLNKILNFNKRYTTQFSQKIHNLVVDYIYSLIEKAETFSLLFLP